MRTSPARGSGSGTLSYLSTSGGPNSWMTIAFIRFLYLHHVNPSSVRFVRTHVRTASTASIDLHPGSAHDALPFDGIGLDQVAELGRGHVGGVDEVGFQPLSGVGIAAERTHIAVELLDDVGRRPAGREQRKPGRGLEAGKSLLGEGGHVGQIRRALR